MVDWSEMLDSKFKFVAKGEIIWAKESWVFGILLEN